jgi:hypothetical protein
LAGVSEPYQGSGMKLAQERRRKEEREEEGGKGERFLLDYSLRLLEETVETHSSSTRP